MLCFHRFTGLFCVLMLSSVIWAGQGDVLSPEFRRIVEADWARQEQRLDRSMASADTILSVTDRARRLLDDLSGMAQAPDFELERAALLRLQSRVKTAASQDPSQRIKLYQDVRLFARCLALRNPMFANRPVLFMQRKRFVCQMLHEYLGTIMITKIFPAGGSTDWTSRACHLPRTI